MPAENGRPAAALWLATAGGAGYFPVGPGTAGSAVGVALAWLMLGAAGWHRSALLLAVLVLLAPAVWACGQAARYWKSEDPQRVVVDEVLGQWLTLAAAPALQWKYWLAAFVLFRVFDIWKPFPARLAERLPGGWGVMTDDLVAGAYGAVVLVLLQRLNF